MRGALVGFPTWIALLWLLPLTGLGVMPCFTLATLLAVAAVVLAERYRRRRAGAPAPEGPAGGARPRRPMSPLAAAGLTLAGVALLIYVVFVIRSA